MPFRNSAIELAALWRVAPLVAAAMLGALLLCPHRLAGIWDEPRSLLAAFCIVGFVASYLLFRAWNPSRQQRLFVASSRLRTVVRGLLVVGCAFLTVRTFHEIRQQPLEFDELNEIAVQMYVRDRKVPAFDHKLTLAVSGFASKLIGPSKFAARISALLSLAFLLWELAGLVELHFSPLVAAVLLAQLLFNPLWVAFLHMLRGYVFDCACSLLILRMGAGFAASTGRRGARRLAVSLLLVPFSNPFAMIFSLGVLLTTAVHFFWRRRELTATERGALVSAARWVVLPTLFILAALLNDSRYNGPEIHAGTFNLCATLRNFFVYTLGGGGLALQFRALALLAGCLVLGFRGARKPSDAILIAAPVIGWLLLVAAAATAKATLLPRYQLVCLLPLVLALVVACENIGDSILRGASQLLAFLALVVLGIHPPADLHSFFYYPPAFESFMERVQPTILAQPPACVSFEWQTRLGQFFADYSRYYFLEPAYLRNQSPECERRFHIVFAPRALNPFQYATPQRGDAPPPGKLSPIYDDGQGNTLYQVMR